MCHTLATCHARVQWRRCALCPCSSREPPAHATADRDVARLYRGFPTSTWDITQDLVVVPSLRPKRSSHDVFQTGERRGRWRGRHRNHLHFLRETFSDTEELYPARHRPWVTSEFLDSDTEPQDSIRSAAADPSTCVFARPGTRPTRLISAIF